MVLSSQSVLFPENSVNATKMTVWLYQVKSYSYRNAAVSNTAQTIEIRQFRSEKTALNGLSYKITTR